LRDRPPRRAQASATEPAKSAEPAKPTEPTELMAPAEPLNEAKAALRVPYIVGRYQIAEPHRGPQVELSKRRHGSSVSTARAVSR
jgi:hypothetical protein